MGSVLVSPKTILISTSVVAVVIIMLLFIKASVPLPPLDFTIVHQPTVLYTSLLSNWLKPPYLYLLINTIILSIAVSSCFHHHHHTPSSDSDSASASDHHLPHPLIQSVPEIQLNRFDTGFEVNTEFLAEQQQQEEEEVEAAEYVISKSDWIPPRRLPEEDEEVAVVSPPLKVAEVVQEKPLVSARFGHRKPIRASPEGGRALRVSKPKKQETLENTWKTITEGRAMPLTRHLKKSETWENHYHNHHIVHNEFRDVNIAESTMVKKSETLKDRTNYNHQLLPPVGKCGGGSPSPASIKLRKEPSLTQDELNRRVEAFIKKFNEEMRLQRQQSLNQYMEMVNRGTH